MFTKAVVWGLSFGFALAFSLLTGAFGRVKQTDSEDLIPAI